MKKLLPLLIFLSLVFTFGCKPQKESVIVNFEGKSYEKKWGINELNKEMPSDW